MLGFRDSLLIVAVATLESTLCYGLRLWGRAPSRAEDENNHADVLRN